MIDRRNVLGLLAAGLAAPRALALEDSEPTMGSGVFAWDRMTARPNDAGSVRPVCKSPTATLEELEIHITTLDPGKSRSSGTMGLEDGLIGL